MLSDQAAPIHILIFISLKMAMDCSKIKVGQVKKYNFRPAKNKPGDLWLLGLVIVKQCLKINSDLKKKFPMLKMWIKTLWKMTAGFVFFIYKFVFVMVFFLDTYILTPFSLIVLWNVRFPKQMIFISFICIIGFKLTTHNIS